jgi:hypothetical protein
MYHKTRSGKKIKLKHMDKQHLINTIKLIQKHAAEGITVTLGVSDSFGIDGDLEHLEGTEVLDFFGYWKYKNELNKREEVESKTEKI